MQDNGGHRCFLTPFFSFSILFTEITVNGKPAMTLVYTGDTPITAKNLVLLTIDGDTGYATTLEAVPETYSAYESTFQKMLNSFKINN